MPHRNVAQYPRTQYHFFFYMQSSYSQLELVKKCPEIPSLVGFYASYIFEGLFQWCYRSQLPIFFHGCHGHVHSWNSFLSSPGQYAMSILLEGRPLSSSSCLCWEANAPSRNPVCIITRFVTFLVNPTPVSPKHGKGPHSRSVHQNRG